MSLASVVHLRKAKIAELICSGDSASFRTRTRRTLAILPVLIACVRTIDAALSRLLTVPSISRRQDPNAHRRWSAKLQSEDSLAKVKVIGTGFYATCNFEHSL